MKMKTQSINPSEHIRADVLRESDGCVTLVISEVDDDVLPGNMVTLSAEDLIAICRSVEKFMARLDKKPAA